MTGWTIRGTTELAANRWPELIALPGDWRAAWADLDGMHINVAPPATLPVTTHLWAWTVGGWLRVRVDGNRWWASALLHTAGIDSSLWLALSEPIDVAVDSIRSWSPTDGRVAQMRIAAGTITPTMWQLVPIAERTAVYIGAPNTFVST
jgi:hypothetical protein